MFQRISHDISPVYKMNNSLESTCMTTKGTIYIPDKIVYEPKTLRDYEIRSYDDLKGNPTKQRFSTIKSNKLDVYIHQLNIRDFIVEQLKNDPHENSQFMLQHLMDTVDVHYTETIISYTVEYIKNKKPDIRVELIEEYKQEDSLPVADESLRQIFNYNTKFSNLNGWEQNLQDTYPIYPDWVNTMLNQQLFKRE